MKTSRIYIAGMAAVLAASLVGCSNIGKPPVDKNRAEKAIQAIQSDPHIQPNQKAAMIAEIKKQLN